MKNILLMLMGISSILFSLNCGNTVNDEHKAEEHSESKEIVEITQAQMEAVGIKLGSFEKRNLRTSVKANGVLELPPQNRATVSAVLGGTVKRILVIEGDYVKEGETIALLEHPQYIELQQDYAETLNRFRFLEQDFERKKKLYDENISSGKEFQETETDYKSAKSKLNSLKAKLLLLGLDLNNIEEGDISTSVPLKAPIHGYVRKIEVNIGTYVEPQTDMFEIVDNHHIHIDLLVYENDINKIKKGQVVNFTVSNLKNKEMHAKVFAVGRAFEEELKAIRIHAEIENPGEELIPGMYVDGRIIVDNYSASSLPEPAVIREGELSSIFIQTKEEHDDKHEDNDNNKENDNHEENGDDPLMIRFKKVPVKTGVIDNGFTEITLLEEIPENSKVAIAGAYYLDSEMNKGEAEHNH